MAAFDFFRWALEEGQKQGGEHDYVPLPASLVSQLRCIGRKTSAQECDPAARKRKPDDEETRCMSLTGMGDIDYMLRLVRFDRRVRRDTQVAVGRLYWLDGRSSKKANTSEVFTTSAYFAFMSQRLIAWLAWERSKQPSSASVIR